MHIATVIFPVFAVAILGYLLTWAGAFRVKDIPGLTRYVFYIALPVMLFDSMSQVVLPERVRWSFLIAYYVPTVMLFVLTMLLGRRFFRHSVRESGIYGMGCSYSNTVLVGLPVITTAWGDTAILPLMMIIALHAGVMFSLTTAVAEAGASPSNREGSRAEEARAPLAVVALRTAAGMARNPIVGGLAIGLVFNILDIPVAAPILTVTSWIRASALPAALFVTGASLRQYRIAGHLAETGMIILAKMVVHPLLVWIVAALVLRLPPLWTAVATATAALPTGINASVFAGKYDAVVAPITSSILVTTALSIVTLTVLLAVFTPLFY